MKKEESKKYFEDMRLHAHGNELEIVDSKECGCLHCGQIFSARDVVDFDTFQGEMSGICPVCGCTEIIGDSSGFDLHSPEFAEAIIKNKKAFPMSDDFVMMTYCRLYEEGVINATEKTESLYVKYLELLFASSNPVPCFSYSLGALYLNGGLTVKPDYEMAIGILSSSELAGDHRSLLLLGRAYTLRNGRGDAKLAYEATTKALAMGNNEAIGDLGVMYYLGRFVKKDFAFAFVCLNRAIDVLYNDIYRGEINLLWAADYAAILGDCAKYGHGTEYDDNFEVCSYLLSALLLAEYHSRFPHKERTVLEDNVVSILSELFPNHKDSDSIIYDEDTFYDSFWYHRDTFTEKRLVNVEMSDDVLYFGIDSDLPLIVIDSANGLSSASASTDWTFYNVASVKKGPSPIFHDIRFEDDRAISFINLSTPAEEVSLRIEFYPDTKEN